MEEVRLVKENSRWYVVNEKNKKVVTESFDTWDTAKPVQMLNRTSKVVKPVAKDFVKSVRGKKR